MATTSLLKNVSSTGAGSGVSFTAGSGILVVHGSFAGHTVSLEVQSDGTDGDGSTWIPVRDVFFSNFGGVLHISLPGSPTIRAVLQKAGHLGGRDAPDLSAVYAYVQHA